MTPNDTASGAYTFAVATLNGAEHRQRAGDREPPDRLPGNAEPGGELRGGQEVRLLHGGRFRLPGTRYEGRGQGPGDCFQQLTGTGSRASRSVGWGMGVVC